MTEARLRLAVRLLAGLGLLIAGYLTWVHYAGLQPFCVSGGKGCETVQSSPYAIFLGIPVPVLGLTGYLLILASTFVRGEAGRVLGAFLVFGGWLFSVYLTYLELGVIHAICQWCVASATVMTLLLVATASRFLRGGR